MGEKALEADNFVFSDDSEIADVFRDDVALVQTLGVMKQKPDGAFHPQDPYTIEESIVTFHRLAAQVKGEMPPLLNPSIQKELVKELNTGSCNILHIDDNFAIVEMWDVHTRGTE